jgi:hypothetical protein
MRTRPTSAKRTSRATAAAPPATGGVFSFSGPPDAGRTPAASGTPGGFFGESPAFGAPSVATKSTQAFGASSSHPANNQPLFGGTATSAFGQPSLPTKHSSSSRSAATAPSSQPAGPTGSLPISEEILNALAILTKAGYPVTAKDLPRLAEPDIYETEMVVMSEVRGYFQVAYKVRRTCILSHHLPEKSLACYRLRSHARRPCPSAAVGRCQ